MIVSFIYVNCVKDVNKEKVIKHLCNISKQYIKLPDSLDIEIQNFDSPNYEREYRSVLAETVLDCRLKVNRVRINSQLSEKELVIPFVHELIHLNQVVEGRLSVYKNGDILWEGKRYQIKNPRQSTYEYYENLPWEVDVRSREKKLLKTIMESI